LWDGDFAGKLRTLCDGGDPRHLHGHPLRETLMINLPQALRIAALAAASAAAVSLVGCAGMRGEAPMGVAPAGVSATNFSATLSSAAEVPPNASPATGAMTASLNKDTSVLTWRVTYSGLTGPATMAHFHGPALPGANAGVVVPFPSAASPAEGSATLTAAQIADLTAGKWYVNVHTAANPGGEIRGQVMVK
jgi:hypothetical protein